MLPHCDVPFPRIFCVENQMRSPEICWLNKRDGWHKPPDKERALPVVGRKWDFMLFPLASFKNTARNWCKVAHLTHKAGKWETGGLKELEQYRPSQYIRGVNIRDLWSWMAAAIFPWNVFKGLKPPAAPENYFSGESFLQRIISPEKSVQWFLQPQKLWVRWARCPDSSAEPWQRDLPKI